MYSRTLQDDTVRAELDGRLSTQCNWNQQRLTPHARVGWHCHVLRFELGFDHEAGRLIGIHVDPTCGWPIPERDPEHSTYYSYDSVPFFAE
jgi:hypothetical protein